MPITRPLKILITPGEPAGIGPDLAVVLAQQQWPGVVTCIADPTLLTSRAEALGLPLEIQTTKQDKPTSPGQLRVIPQALQRPATPGTLDPANARYVVETITRGCQACLSGEYDALVTGPVQKSVINAAGIPFSGHTELLAELCKVQQPVMLLSTPALRVALVTTHLPLHAVSAAITAPRLEQVIRVLAHDLRHRFGLANPRIAVCGLNPHAGESGYLGDEEIRVIGPVLDALREQGFNLSGPLPADTAFTPAAIAASDVILAMYHDQGLPTLKHQGFGLAVNVTLGLPIVRTSVDHGTALDIAGSGTADASSFGAALALAFELSAQSQAQ